MVDYNAPLYEHEPEVWDKKKCEKMAKRFEHDAWGNRYHFRGYIGSFERYGKIWYNGGCVRDDEWWQGENFPFPIVDEEFEIVKYATWGYQIVKRVNHA